VKLFQRRPFALTSAGRELFAFAEPFFSRIGQVSRQLRSEEKTHGFDSPPRPRSARSTCPELLRNHQRKYPSLSLRLHDANQAEAERLLQKHEIDLAVTELEGTGRRIELRDFVQAAASLTVRGGSRSRSRRSCGATGGWPGDPDLAAV